MASVKTSSRRLTTCFFPIITDSFITDKYGMMSYDNKKIISFFL